jgi:hypothetical protein
LALKSILVKTGAGGRDGKFATPPDFVTDNLLDAVRLLLAQKEQ